MLNAIDRREFLMGLAAAGGAAVLAAGSRTAAAAAPVAVPRARNVVLVHGAYADGSCWVEIIPRLQQAGLNVTAVQNPLQSLAEDCAFTQRVLDLQDGPTVLVGHSYAGEVITQTGVHPKVSALVYCSARAPDADEDYTALAKTYPTPPASAGVVHAGGYAWLGEEAFLRDFAGDVDPAKARVLYAVQGRVSDALFTAKVTQAAWRSKPSFYQVSAQDRTINPDLQRFMTRRMGAKTIELPSSHLGIVSHPQEIAALILQAAGAA
ncbi:alpha/beta hydrolase [Inquilinus sp. NPDC058860]|uniref:alpha/beta hydrolase n=1 Tax=Inquilinus sp. NPDC058860 TaxID=3346652 RepID=UPI0036771AF8